MGFAGILRELKLPHGEFVPALVSFNVGIEQLASATRRRRYGLFARGGLVPAARLVPLPLRRAGVDAHRRDGGVLDAAAGRGVLTHNPPQL